MIVRAGHSRLPVFEESLDNIVGILYAKDLLPYLKGNGRATGQIDLRALVRPPVYVPESKAVDDLLHDMQAPKRHIAIVVDEYGGTAGLVTIEDVVEEIVGEIQDEYDTEEAMVEPFDRRGLAFRLDGRVSMDDLRDLFDLLGRRRARRGGVRHRRRIRRPPSRAHPAARRRDPVPRRRDASSSRPPSRVASPASWRRVRVAREERAEEGDSDEGAVATA